MNDVWYNRRTEESKKIDQNFKIFRELYPLEEKKIEAVLKSLRSQQFMRVVYESNLIEGAGPKRKGETREIIEKYFPKIPDSLSAFDSLGNAYEIYDLIDTHKYHQLLALPEEKLKRCDFEFSVRFGKKNREVFEVIQHMSALIDAVITAESSFYNDFLYKKTKLKKYHSEKKLITEDFIKDLHKKIAKDLIRESCGVCAGEYRIHDVTIDDDSIKFPASELVADCMKLFVKKANNLIEDFRNHKISPIVVAANISYDFVRIHPFPDFNGRISRLLLNVVLRASNIPFVIDIRGANKHKHRYFTALRHANRGNMKSYECLIAMRVNDIFKTMFDELKLAGVEVKE